MLVFKLLPELISVTLSIYVTLTTPTNSIKALEKCQPGVAEKQASGAHSASIHTSATQLSSNVLYGSSNLPLFMDVV